MQFHLNDITDLLITGMAATNGARTDRPTYTLIIQAVISVLFIAGYGGVLWVVLQPGAEFSPSAEKLATFVLGALTTALVSISDYWFRDDHMHNGGDRDA